MTSDWLWRASETLNAIDPPTRLAFAERSLARTPSDHPRHNDRRFWCAIRALTVRFGPESERVAMELLAGSCLTEAQELALETRLAVGYASQQRRADVDRIAFASRRPRLMAMELAVMVVNVRLGEGDLAGAEAAFDAVLALASDDHPFGAQFTELWLRGGDYEASYLEVTASLAQTILRVLLGASGGALASARQVYQEWQGIALQPSASHAILALAFADAAASEWHDVYARVSRGTWHASSEIDCVAGIAAMLEGSWDDAAAHIATALAREEDSGASLYRSVTAGIGALLAVHRGDVEGFAAWDTRAAESGPGLGSSLTLAARGLDAEAHDNINEARRLLEEAWAWDGALQLGIWQRRYAADLVRVALACGAPTLARSVVDRVEELASLGDTDVARAAAGRCRGLLDNDPVVLLEVAATFDVAGWPIEAAWAREDAAVALARLARPAEAREQLGVAVAAFEQVGAYGDLRRALRRLRVHNVRRPTRPAAPRPTFGWGSLTEAERRVVDLASTGLTYREIGEQLFISRRTVETHVAHVFTKLGVRNKAQLALAFSQLHDEP
jgi:DNA-binding CsgD family transcriptional regulator